MIQSFFQVAVAAAIFTSGGDDPAGPRGPVAGTEPGPTEVARYTGTEAQIEVATPAVESADIDIDGRLDDASWEQAALLDGFTQYDPIEGSPASQRTEVLVLV
ncbi:MAG: hypothetical protein ACKVIN_13275, partial [Longimicrobiales bacterium]